MSNENSSSNFKIVFDSNSSASYGDGEHNNSQTAQSQQQQPQQQEMTQAQEGKQGIVRSFRGVNWDEASTNLLLDIYKSKFPLLESTPHNKGRKQIYEEMRAQFNSNGDIENKRTLKSLTRKWGEMLAKYRIRRGIQEKTGKLPDVQWRYHERMHEIVGHLPPNGRLSFPATNKAIESNSFIAEKINTSCSWISTSSTSYNSDENTTSNKRARTEGTDENNETTDISEAADGAPLTSSAGLQIQPIQPKTLVQANPSIHQSSGPAAKAPRRLEPKRTPISSNSNNSNSSDKGRDTPSIQNGIIAEAPSIQADNHDLRSTLERLLETGRRVAEPSTEQSISESLRIIAEASKQMAESNRLLAQQIENNSKTTEILLEEMKNLIESLNTKGVNSDNILVDKS
jgi:hypothetical protein